MGGEECFGELYCLKNDFPGEWIISIIERINALQCIFGVESQIKPNGINVVYKVKWGLEESDTLGKVISSFLVRSYITKIFRKFNPDGEECIYLIPINLVLSTLDRDYTILVNKECIQTIMTILNHPHFSGCTSVEEIEKRLPNVKDLNNRFTKD